MCQFCDPRPQAAHIDPLMGDTRSFQFFSMAAIDEAIRQTSGGCAPVCDHHRAMFGLDFVAKEQEEDDSSSKQNTNDDGDDEYDDEYDGT